MTAILALAKVVAKREYAEDLLSGRLFMNTLAYFVAYPEEPMILRSDSFEGLAAWYRATEIEVTFNGISIPSPDIGAPVAIQYDSVLGKNAYCLYSLNSRGHEQVSSESLKDLKRKLEIPSDCFGFGDYCVVIHKPLAFIDRCCASIKKAGLSGRLGLVDYFDELTFHGLLPAERQGLIKRRAFENQREYRVIVDTRRDPPGPFTLDVGNLSDIAIVTTPGDFNRCLTLQLPDGSRA